MRETPPTMTPIDIMMHIKAEPVRQVPLGLTDCNLAKLTKSEWRAILALQTLKLSNVLANDDATDFQLDRQLAQIAALTLAWREARGRGNNNNSD